MKYVNLVIGFAFACASLGMVSAQTACPAGVPPGDPRCGPSPEWHQPEQTASAPPRVITREWIWEDRWGAIVSDREGPIGTANGHKRRAGAIRAATSDCIERGGDSVRCKEVARVYRNACGTYVWGGGLAVTSYGPDIGEIESESLAECEADNSQGAKCRVVHTGCSRAEHVGFRYY